MLQSSCSFNHHIYLKPCSSLRAPYYSDSSQLRTPLSSVMQDPSTHSVVNVISPARNSLTFLSFSSSIFQLSACTRLPTLHHSYRPSCIGGLYNNATSLVFQNPSLFSRPFSQEDLSNTRPRCAESADTDIRAATAHTPTAISPLAMNMPRAHSTPYW